MSAGAAASAAAAAELHLKMCKKVAQLTKVIFQLNTRNEDYQAEAERTRSSHTTEIQRLTQDATDKMRVLQTKLQNQTASAAQRERQHIVDRQQLINETQQQQRSAQASRAAVEEAFQTKVTEMEIQVQDAQRAFDERLEQITQLAATKERERALSSENATTAFEVRLDELKEKHIEEVEQLVTTSNAKYNRMLAEQLRAQDALKADLVSAKHDWEKQKQEVAAEHERQRLANDMAGERQRLADEMAGKAAFDQMKHELVTKIEALLADAETLRGSETKLRLEKETLVKNQQEAARNIKQLELQLSKAQQDSQSVRRDASAHSEELQRMLGVSTGKIDELAQELVTTKQILQTRDRALTEVQKELEASQLETLQRNANASEVEAQLKQQLQERDLQLANGKCEARAASQQFEAGQKQISALEEQLTSAQKSVREMQTDGATSALSLSKLQQELEHADAVAKQAELDNERAMALLKQTHESMLQNLTSSHALEMETQRTAATTQLEQLESRMREASAKSSDEKVTKLINDHQKVLSEHETASKSAQTKHHEEITKLEAQVKHFQEQLTGQTQKLAELQTKYAELTRQLESSQQQVAKLQSTNDALHSAAQKSQKDREEEYQKQLRELTSQRESTVKTLTKEKTQQQQQHANALAQLTLDHAASCEQLEAQKIEALKNQENTMRDLYEPQLARLCEDLENLQRALGVSTEEASEARRSMEETRLFEQEHLRSAIVSFAQQTAEDCAHAEDISRQKLEKLQQSHSQRERELERQFLDESQAQLASLQAKADADFAKLSSDHRQELLNQAQQNAEALQKLQQGLESSHHRSSLVERADAKKQLDNLTAQKNRERTEALLEAQNTHDQQYGELKGRLEVSEAALAQKTLEWVSATRDGQSLSVALAAKTEEVAQKTFSLENSREQVEALKLAAKREMDKLLEENLAETKQLSDQFEETRSVMAEKVAYLKASVAEWQDKYNRRESRSEDVLRIVELERLVVEKDALARRTLDEMAYFKRELLNREEIVKASRSAAEANAAIANADAKPNAGHSATQV
ncbi:hypothetical protein BBO99_00004429 [Phytophthora kernoviae]|uniref:Protein FAM184A/B N-terminal domain-containing protein n=2 Tax=Phytophthora kernoviae TaxID=325452 RepID=A0A3R7HXH1_9STRA|nr:hypothetical protein G195_006750 [Phytophthora kernoviae 00238/432]KAG2524515.1 hypothetical protein JM16_004883 [Phytophthora kernoviae]KAG2526220.1 hypothetical protein JM18_004458 [Phytophthora kernoviae]RLN80529.1 hypothetical protein BBO99_00004429 [Phytophthora kernoviae]